MVNFRLFLRQDNADLRLTPFAKKIGSACDERKKIFKEKLSYIEKLRPVIQKASITPDEINPILEKLGESKIQVKTRLHKILARPQVSFNDISQAEAIKDFFKNHPRKKYQLKEIDEKYKILKNGISLIL